MKNSIKYIVVITILLLIQSCIKESFNSCPDWGKYKVGFYSSSNKQHDSANDIIILYNGIDSSKSPILYRSSLLLDTSYIGSTNLLKLFPGKYSFCALLAQESLALTDIIKFKNGLRYLYAGSNSIVKKSPLNKVGLFFNLANSMVGVKCYLDSSLHNYTISQLEISPPEEKNAHFKISNGMCSYEQCTTDFYDNAIYDNTELEWIYYCNPIVPGNDLRFRITLLDNTNKVHIMLTTKVFLSTGLEQGKVYRFHLNVTPSKIEYISSTIIDWIDYIHHEDIEL